MANNTTNSIANAALVNILVSEQYTDMMQNPAHVVSGPGQVSYVWEKTFKWGFENHTVVTEAEPGSQAFAQMFVYHELHKRFTAHDTAEIHDALLGKGSLNTVIALMNLPHAPDAESLEYIIRKDIMIEAVREFLDSKDRESIIKGPNTEAAIHAAIRIAANAVLLAAILNDDTFTELAREILLSVIPDPAEDYFAAFDTVGNIIGISPPTVVVAHDIWEAVIGHLTVFVEGDEN